MGGGGAGAERGAAAAGSAVAAATGIALAATVAAASAAACLGRRRGLSPSPGSSLRRSMLASSSRQRRVPPGAAPESEHSRNTSAACLGESMVRRARLRSPDRLITGHLREASVVSVERDEQDAEQAGRRCALVVVQAGEPLALAGEPV